MFLYAGIARYFGLFRHFSYRKNLTNLFITPHVFALKSSKSSSKFCVLLMPPWFPRRFPPQAPAWPLWWFCLGLQPFHFLLCGMESSVGVIVQRHYDVGVSHDVLQCLGVHARVCHSGTECMPHGVRRHHIGQRLLVALVVLLGKALEHGVIVDGGFGQAARLGTDRMYPSAL